MKTKYSLINQQRRAIAVGVALMSLTGYGLAGTFEDAGATPADVLIFALFLVFSCCVLLRVHQIGVTVDELRVVVCNPFRTIRIPWSSIRGFSFGNPKSFIWGTGVVELKDGEFITVVALWPASQQNQSPGKLKTLEIIGLLNAHLAEHPDEPEAESRKASDSAAS